MLRTLIKPLAAAAILAAILSLKADGATPIKSWQGSVVYHGATVYSQQSTCPIALGVDGAWDTTSGHLRWRKANGQDVGLLRQEGVIPAARVAFSVNPTAADTLSIGGKTFTFKAALVAATTTTQVKILGSAALTLAATIDAINGVSNVNVVADTTPFTLSVVADAVSATVLRIRKADAQGGTAIPGTVSTTALAASITGGASAWSAANLNVTGKAATDLQITHDSFVVTAAMITNGSWQQELPFTPTEITNVYVRSSAGVLRAYNEAVTISGNAVNFVLAGGGSPNAQAGDIIGFIAVQ